MQMEMKRRKWTRLLEWKREDSDRAVPSVQKYRTTCVCKCSTVPRSVRARLGRRGLGDGSDVKTDNNTPGNISRAKKQTTTFTTISKQRNYVAIILVDRVTSKKCHSSRTGNHHLHLKVSDVSFRTVS
jgi:hypothetical protein